MSLEGVMNFRKFLIRGKTLGVQNTSKNLMSFKLDLGVKSKLESSTSIKFCLRMYRKHVEFNRFPVSFLLMDKTFKDKRFAVTKGRGAGKQ